MPDREKVINGLTEIANFFDIMSAIEGRCNELKQDAENAIAFLKEQEKKEIKLHKKHVLILNRNDEFSMRKLYESVCEKLLDEGEMAITRTDNHENVEFVFYMVND